MTVVGDFSVRGGIKTIVTAEHKNTDGLKRRRADSVRLQTSQ